MIFSTKTLNPENKRFEAILKHAVAPRPICFASTRNKDGQINLSPFSYFNIVSQNPAICMFSPLRRMRDNSTKHTLENLREVPEVVINIVNYNIVQQQSLASTEYEKGVDEFVKSGLTPVASTIISPPRVAESPVQLECKVQNIISLGKTPGSGNLVLAEVLCMHIHDDLLDKEEHINQAALDLVARLGGNWYCRVTPDNLFEVAKPLARKGIGVDQLPDKIRYSKVLTGNHLGQLANVERVPAPESSGAISLDTELEQLKRSLAENEEEATLILHQKVAEVLDHGDVDLAWRILMLH